jgi:hypothetical protein
MIHKIEKARELVDAFKDLIFDEMSPESSKAISKLCALVVVDEMLNFQDRLFITEGSLAYSYWQEVKQEIEKL